MYGSRFNLEDATRIGGVEHRLGWKCGVQLRYGDQAFRYINVPKTEAAIADDTIQVPDGWEKIKKKHYRCKAVLKLPKRKAAKKANVKPDDERMLNS